MYWVENVVPAVITLLGGALGWFLKSQVDARRRAQEALRDERARVYVDILMPFIRIFSDQSATGQDGILRDVKSVEYRKLAFQLVLVGDDKVVRAWSNLWQTLYRTDTKIELDPKMLLEGLGEVLLSIRKSLGNRGTSLDKLDTLRWMIKDIDSLS